MFEKILAWIREAIKKMFGTSTIAQALQIDVAISSQMASALQLWSQMYAGQAPWLSTEIKSLNLPAAIAGEIARAVTIEMQAAVSGSPRAAFLQKQLDQVVPKLREHVEKGCAKGGLVMKPYLSGGQVLVDFVQADMFYPVAFDGNGALTACVFADQKTIGDKYYTRLESHQLTHVGEVVRNLAFQSTSREMLGRPVPLSMVGEWAEIEPEATITGVDRPLYAYFKYPLANNLDPTSPLGVSCYSRAAELIKQADIQWSQLLWEFESGQRALYVDLLAFGKDADGRPALPNKRLYRALDTGGSDDALFKEWTPNLREQNYINGLDAILRKIEFECGLAYGVLSNPATVDKTATELRISNQRSFATITDTQKALEHALDDLLYAVDVWVSLGGLAPTGAYKAVYDFDDSIVVDKDSQFQQDARLVGMGVMSKWEFRMRNFGEDEAIARQKIADVQAERPEVDPFQGA